MNARTEIPLGIFHGVPIADYHASAGISNSGLGDFARSPLHFHALHLNPARPAEEETPAQLVGSLAHCMILEPEAFMQRYAVGPVDDKRLAAWKAWEALPRPKGIECIKPSQHEVAKAQALSVRSIPDVAQLLATGAPEVSAYWTDHATGELCRCRPDWVHPVQGRGVILVDVKTCGNASPQEFARQIGRMAYHRQAAWYTDGYSIAAETPVLGFIFIAVETAWPFAASAVMLDDESLEQGRTENAELLERFSQCRKADSWPSYSNAIELVTLPRWAAAPVSTTEESLAA